MRAQVGNPFHVTLSRGQGFFLFCHRHSLLFTGGLVSRSGATMQVCAPSAWAMVCFCVAVALSALLNCNTFLSGFRFFEIRINTLDLLVSSSSRFTDVPTAPTRHVRGVLESPLSSRPVRSTPDFGGRRSLRYSCWDLGIVDQGCQQPARLVLLIPLLLLLLLFKTCLSSLIKQRAFVPAEPF